MQSTSEKVDSSKNKNDFREMMLGRTIKLGVDTVNFLESMPANHAGEAIGEQLLQSAMAVGMTYRAMTRTSSKEDFIGKFSTVAAEAEKCQYWIELLQNLKLGSAEASEQIKKDAGTVIAIVLKSIKTSTATN